MVSVAGKRSVTFIVSLLAHTCLLAALIVLPLLFASALPAPARAIHAFFVAPLEAPVPPPPPPPPPPAGRRASVAHTPKPIAPAKFVAPVEIPSALPPVQESLDLGGGGVPGGVEGGVPGGVVGGIVGGLPSAPPKPPPAVVRVGGRIQAPALLRRVAPEYPELARTARVHGVVILEARVDTRGYVENVKVLRGIPLLDEPAVEAVKEWRYRPLLLNGVPTAFIVAVTVDFNLE